MDKIKKLGNFKATISFLTLELLALVAFNLGGKGEIFYIAGFIIAILGVIFTFDKFKSKNELISLVPTIVPLIGIAALISFGNLSSEQGGFINTMTFLGLISFFVLGLVARRNKEFKIKYALLSIGFGLALLILVSLIYTWANYGILHVLRYHDTPNYYYYAETYDITKEMGFLFGFSFQDVTLKFTGLYGVILASSLVGLLFIDPRKDKQAFIINASIGGFGLLFLLILPNFEALLFLIPIYLFGGYLRFLYGKEFKDELKEKVRKIVKNVFIVLVVVLALFFFFVFLNVLGVITERVASNFVLNKLFNNERLMMPINMTLIQAFAGQNLFGFVDSPIYEYTELAIRTNTKFFEFEIIKEGGILALLALVIFIFFIVGTMSRYSKKSKDEDYIKAIIMTFIFALFIYSTFAQESFIFIHHEEVYNSFFRSMPASLTLFLLGFIDYPDIKGKPLFEEEVIEETKEDDVLITEYIDDYSFSEEQK